MNLWTTPCEWADRLRKKAFLLFCFVVDNSFLAVILSWSILLKICMGHPQKKGCGRLKWKNVVLLGALQEKKRTKCRDLHYVSPIVGFSVHKARSCPPQIRRRWKSWKGKSKNKNKKNKNKKSLRLYKALEKVARASQSSEVCPQRTTITFVVRDVFVSIVGARTMTSLANCSVQNVSVPPQSASIASSRKTSHWSMKRISAVCIVALRTVAVGRWSSSANFCVLSATSKSSCVKKIKIQFCRDFVFLWSVLLWLLLYICGVLFSHTPWQFWICWTKTFHLVELAGRALCAVVWCGMFVLLSSFVRRFMYNEYVYKDMYNEHVERHVQ